MIKHGTYRVFKHEETGEIKRLTLSDEGEMEKYASTSSWKELEEDPENERES